MAEIEVTLPKRDSLPHQQFYDFICETEDEQIHNDHARPSFKKDLTRHSLDELHTTLMNNKYISPIVKTYQMQGNELIKKLPEIAVKSVLNLSSDPELEIDAPADVREKVKRITNKYGYVNEELVLEMSKWLEHRQRMIELLQEKEHRMRLIKRTTSAIAIITSTVELTRGIGTILYEVFGVGLKPKYSPVLAWVIGSVSVSAAVLALTYSKHTVGSIVRDLREEKYLLRQLMVIERKGNAIDEEVKNLFPHGIDSDLVKQIALDTEKSFTDDESWKLNIAFAIIWHNFNKNKKLINDKKFLTLVKLFVESPAAKIWFYRIKLHKILHEIIASLENHQDKKIFSDNEVFNQAAINLYPVFFPLFVDSGNLKKLRFICSSMAAISAMVNLSQDDGEGFRGIRRTSEILLKDYKALRKFSEDFINEYD